MCSESDLKDLGLPMGPRKKLQGLLKEEQNKKVSELMIQVLTVTIYNQSFYYLWNFPSF